MENFKGKFLDGNSVCIDHIYGRLNLPASQSEESYWSGNFKTSTPEKIILGGRYQIQLNDGRKGKVLVTRIDLYGCFPCIIQFRGIGTLYTA